MLVQVDLKQLKNDDEVPSEVKTVSHFNYAPFVRIFCQNLLEEISLSLSTFNLLTFICTYLYCNKLSTFLHVFAE